MDQQKASPKSSSFVSSKPIRVRSHRYGTIKLRRLSIGTSGFLYTLADLNLPAHEFAVQLIHHYLISLELNLETIRAWPDRLLLRVELVWVQDRNRISNRLPEGKPTLEILQHVLVGYVTEQTQKIREVINANLVDWTSSSNLLQSNIQSTLQNINRAFVDSIQSSMQGLVQQALETLEHSTRGLFQSAIDSFAESIHTVSQDIITVGLDQIRNIRPLLPTLSDLSAFAQMLAESRVVGEEFEASGYGFTGHLWDAAFVDSLIHVSLKSVEQL